MPGKQHATTRDSHGSVKANTFQNLLISWSMSCCYPRCSIQRQMDKGLQPREHNKACLKEPATDLNHKGNCSAPQHHQETSSLLLSKDASSILISFCSLVLPARSTALSSHPKYYSPCASTQKQPFLIVSLTTSFSNYGTSLYISLPILLTLLSNDDLLFQYLYFFLLFSSQPL